MIPGVLSNGESAAGDGAAAAAPSPLSVIAGGCRGIVLSA